MALDDKYDFWEELDARRRWKRRRAMEEALDIPEAPDPYRGTFETDDDERGPSAKDEEPPWEEAVQEYEPVDTENPSMLDEFMDEAREFVGKADWTPEAFYKVPEGERSIEYWVTPALDLKTDDDGYGLQKVQGAELQWLANKKHRQVFFDIFEGKLDLKTSIMATDLRGDHLIRLAYVAEQKKAVILSPFAGKVGARGQEESETAQISSLEEIVLIVECSPEETETLSGFVVFRVDKDKGRLVEQVSDENDLRYFSSTNKVNDGSDGGEDLNDDILGLSGGKTYRSGWCKFSDTVEVKLDFSTRIEKREVEQLHRVDQGPNAYSDDIYTRILFDGGVWTEQSDYYADWTVEPGPCPVGPYTDWEPGDDTIELFYMVVGGDTLQYWWPPNFFQHIYHNWFCHVENQAYPEFLPDGSSVYDHDELWQQTDETLPSTGMAAYWFPDTWCQWQYNIFYDYRIWGIFWGNDLYGCEDSCAFHDEFPYVDPVSAVHYENVLITPYWYGGHDGTYVEDGLASHAYFLIGTARSGAFDIKQETWSRTLREPRDLDNLPEDSYFHHILPDLLPLTDDQMELLKGNEDVAAQYEFEWIEDPFTGLCSIGWSVENGRCPGWDYIQTRDGFYYLCPAIANKHTHKDATEYIEYSDENYGSVFDLGIFTKNKIKDAKTLMRVPMGDVDPVYVYSYQQPYSDAEGFMAIRPVCYGIIFDGKHYRSDWFMPRGSSPWLDGVDIGKTVLDSNGNPIYPKMKVRAGKLKYDVKTILKESRSWATDQ